MLMLQALGLWHGIVHHGVHAEAHAHASHAPGGIFDDHDDGDAQCRLYDQLAHADIAFGSVPVLAGPEPFELRAQAVPAGRLAPQAAGFLARGPPARG